MKLEDELVELLISQIQKRGVNPQSLLDNPLISQLPLDSKIRILKKYTDLAKLKEYPTFQKSIPSSKLPEAVLFGALSGGLLGAVSMKGPLSGGNLVLPMLTAGVGAAVGGIPAGISAYQDYKKHSLIAKELREDRPMSAVLAASSGKPPVNPYLSKVVNEAGGYINKTLINI